MQKFVPLLALAGLSLSGLSSACLAEIAHEADTRPRSGGSITWGVTTEPSCFDPHRSSQQAAFFVARNSIDSLVGKRADGTFAPWLASAWTISPDGREYTFTLLEHVVFHDGEIFDAAAVKANFDFVKNPQNAAGAVALLTAGRGRLSRKLASALELVLASTPVFWIGILLLMLFSFTLRWFPVSGASGWQALVLPSIALALPTAGLLAQVLREAIEKTLDQPFVTTIRARGVGELTIRSRHILRHALLPAVTLGGWLIGGLLGGAVITEKVFGRPGLGSVTLGAVLTHDVPVVLAVVLLAAVIHVAASTLLDILYLLIDPRLRAA